VVVTVGVWLTVPFCVTVGVVVTVGVTFALMLESALGEALPCGWAETWICGWTSTWICGCMLMPPGATGEVPGGGVNVCDWAWGPAAPLAGWVCDWAAGPCCWSLRRLDPHRGGLTGDRLREGLLRQGGRRQQQRGGDDGGDESDNGKKTVPQHGVWPILGRSGFRAWSG
jgi:hypothetical protein